MKIKKIEKTIESLKEDNELLCKYNAFLAKHNHLPGEYRKMSFKEKTSLYNRLCCNLEKIKELMSSINEEIHFLKESKESKKVINKILKCRNFYIDLFMYKLEYSILEYMKADMQNPEILDLKTKYELQLADIEYFNQNLSPLQDDETSNKANEFIGKIHEASNSSNNLISLINELKKTITIGDFDPTKVLDNKNIDLSRKEEINLLVDMQYGLLSILRNNDGKIEYYKEELSKVLKRKVNF